jgi:hypothetical protein
MYGHGGELFGERNTETENTSFVGSSCVRSFALFEIVRRQLKNGGKCSIDQENTEHGTLASPPSNRPQNLEVFPGPFVVRNAKGSYGLAEHTIIVSAIDRSRRWKSTPRA